jgi:hypothetical protein
MFVVTSDDLDAPLGQGKPKKPSKLPAAAPQILAGLLGLFGIAVLVWAIFVNDPLGGEPTAVVATGSIAKPAAKPHADSQPRPRTDEPLSAKAPTVKVTIPSAVTPPPGSKTVTIIDGSSGKRQDVIIPGQSSGPVQKPPVD